MAFNTVISYCQEQTIHNQVTGDIRNVCTETRLRSTGSLSGKRK